MLHGDLSNVAGIVIAFKCEDFLIHFKKSPMTKIKSALGLNPAFDVNTQVLHYMEHLYRNTPYNVEVIVETRNYSKKVQEFLMDSVFCNRIILADKPSQVAGRLLVNDITYYVDDDAERRSLVNSKFAVSFHEIQDILRKR